MNIKFSTLLASVVFYLSGCSASTEYDVSSKLDFDQSTPGNALKQMMKLVEKDDFSGAKGIFSDSAIDDFRRLEQHKLIVSMNVRGLPLDELRLEEEVSGNIATVKLNNKLSQLLRTPEIRLARESTQWKIAEANFGF